MATVCQLTSQFQESPSVLYEMFTHNIQDAQRLGTRWDVIQEENFHLANGNVIKQVIGYSSAFARVDGMGGFVNFVVRFTTDGLTTEVDVMVSSCCPAFVGVLCRPIQRNSYTPPLVSPPFGWAFACFCPSCSFVRYFTGTLNHAND